MRKRARCIGLMCVLILVAVLVLLQISGSHSEALQVDYALVHFQHGQSLRKAAHTKAALREFRKAIRLRWNWQVPLNSAAWILATDPDPEIRRPQEALALARRAAAITGNGSAGILDTLAAAYAAAGRFDDAIDAAEAALALISAEQATDLVVQIQSHLEGYRQGKPYVEQP